MSFINARVIGKGINPKEYHADRADRGDPNLKVSPSMLKEFVRCPARWKANYVSPDSETKQFGSLLDCRLLTPTQFSERYAIQPTVYIGPESAKKDAALIEKPWNNNANICKEWNFQQQEAGKEIVTTYDVADVDAARARLLADPILAAWHEACDTQVLVEGNWQDEATGLFVPVRCLLDYVPRLETEFALCLGDLKTAYSGGVEAFNDAAGKLGYHVQAAFDLALYNAATGEQRTTWCFIGIENYEPWQPFRRMMDRESLDVGRQEYEAALRFYAKCLKEQRFPGYDDNEDAVQGWSVIRLRPWVAFAAMSNNVASEVNKSLTIEQQLEKAGLG